MTKTTGKIRTHQVISVITGSNVFILSLAFYFLGEMSVYYVGALLFFVNGFFSPFLYEKHRNNLFGFFISVVIFFLLVGGYFVLKYGGTGELAHFNPLGFLFYFADFVAFYLLGFLLAKVNKKGIKMLVFYSLTGILTYRAGVFFSHPVAGGLTSAFYFYAGTQLFLKSKIKGYFIVAGLTVPFFLLYFFAGDLKELFLFNTFWIITGLLFSWLFVKKKKPEITLNYRVKVVAGLAIVIFAFYIGSLNLTEYLFNRNTRLPEKKEFAETFTNMEGEKITTADFYNRIVVLDLWTTNCRVCFEKFPEFEKFYKKNKDKVLIYAVGLPFKNQSKQDIKQVVRTLDYHFPFLISDEDFQHYHENYYISGVPAIIILNEDGRIVYNNSLNNNPLIRVNNLQMLVDDLIRQGE